MNFLEQLVAEWYGYQGYFVRTNVRYGKRTKGGYAGEMDVVAFEPNSRVLVHIETSGDAASWEKRERTFQQKFRKAAKYYKSSFDFNIRRIERVAVAGWAKTKRRKNVGNRVKLLTVRELMEQITAGMAKRDVLQTVVPEGYPMLRAIQFTLWVR